jgi:lipid-A-disaccharide synthase-like uncharacterized protein
MARLFAAVLDQLKNPWVAIGFAGQLVFSMRFLVQWIASERRKRSVIPASFWYLSLAGAGLLLTYAVSKADPVFIVGQLLGFVVYLRNLHLLVRSGERESAPENSR